MRFLRKCILAIGAVVLIAVAVVAFDFSFLRGRTPRVDSPRGIASLECLRINGVDQWVLIRGRDRTKPVLLFLHGGPGMPAMFLAHVFQRTLEQDFVVVHWDRRGAGKSFAAGLTSGPLSVSQTLEDTYELTRDLRARFGQQRIYLVGHSWGSYLGLLAVRGHPEYYAAFIGTGQIAGTGEQVRLLRRQFLSRVATESRDPKLLARVAHLDADVSEDDLFRYGGELCASRSFWPILMAGLTAPEYTLKDALHVKKGADRVGREMQYDVAPALLKGEIQKVEIPIFFFVGRHDFNTPSQLAEEYLTRLDAPLKRLVWFEHSAHFPFFEEPELFHQEMVRAHAVVKRFWEKRSPL